MCSSFKNADFNVPVDSKPSPMDVPINESQYGQLLASLTKLGNQDNGGSANTSMLAGIGMCLLSTLDVWGHFAPSTPHGYKYLLMIFLEQLGYIFFYTKVIPFLFSSPSSNLL